MFAPFWDIPAGAGRHLHGAKRGRYGGHASVMDLLREDVTSMSETRGGLFLSSGLFQAGTGSLLRACFFLAA